MNERIKSAIAKLKNGKAIMIIGLAGILLIFLSSLLPQGKTDTSKAKGQTANTEEEYLSSLQAQMTSLVKKITGCKAQVVITLDTGVTYNYAAETKTEQSSKNGEKTQETEQSDENKKTLVTDSEGAQNPIVINSFLPQIRGVAVVYSAADSEYLNAKISEALKAALSVTSNQIFIYGNGG